MSVHPADRDLSKLEARYRKRRREVTWSAIVWAVIGTLILYRTFWWEEDDDSRFEALRVMAKPILAIAGLISFIVFAVLAQYYGQVVRQLKETRAIREAVQAHHDLPSRVVANLLGKKWQWRALCLSGAVMATSASALATLIYVDSHSRLLLNVNWVVFRVIFLALPMACLWSAVRFAVAGVRFLRYARAELRDR